MSISGRDSTRNQYNIDTDRSKLLLFGNSSIEGTYENISGGVESVALGQLMGRVAATGNLVICKSAAIDGSQFPVGVAIDPLTDVADAATVTNYRIANGGEINESLLAFDGSDDLDTVIDGRTMRDLLIANSRDIKLVIVEDDTKFDN